MSDDKVVPISKKADERRALAVEHAAWYRAFLQEGFSSDQAFELMLRQYEDYGD